MVKFIKKNVKILCLCMFCFLLFAFFVLYWKKNAEWSREELPAWKKQRVEEVCTKEWGRPNFELNADMYYGTCHGCVVLFSGGMLQAITEISVADEVFSYSSVFSIWVYRAGELVELKDAYEKNWITKENIKDIAEYHRQRTGGDSAEKLVSINVNGDILQLPEKNVAISESNSFGIAFEPVYTMSSTSHYNIYRSLDIGITWELLVEDFKKEVADFKYIDIVDENTIRCFFETSGVTEKESIYVSEDGGVTWVSTLDLAITSTPMPSPTPLPTPTVLPVASVPQYVLSKSQEEYTTEDGEMMRAYISVLEGLLYDEELPEHDVEVEYVYTTYPDMFAICDIDADGKDELYITHIATYNAGMFSVIYEYEDGNLHRELLADTLLRFYDNGAMIQKAMHNHGMAAGEGSDFWPYTLFQHDKETDTYVAVANVEAWDKSYMEKDVDGTAFPDEADADGDGRVYYVMPGTMYEWKEPIDNAAYKEWICSYMEGAMVRYKLPTLDLTKESLEELKQFALTIPTLTQKELTDTKDFLGLLKNNYDGEIPSSASSPYVLQAATSNIMIVFGQGATTLIYVTQDGGTTWEQAEIPEVGKHQHAIVTCATVIRDTMYCIGYRYWGEYDGAFYLTKDCGKTWIRLMPEDAIPKDITSNMRYSEAVSVIYSEDRLEVQVSCKTKDYLPWSIEVKLESVDMGESWKIVEIWEQETDVE